MIIQCRKCETRFRFDEKLIEGDGVWVRCSRCQNVFFQERSNGEILSSTPAGPEIPSVRISDAKRSQSDRFPLAEEHTPREDKEKTELPLPGPADQERGVYPEIDNEPVINAIETGMDKESLGIPITGGDDSQAEEMDIPETEPAARGWGVIILKIFALILVTIMITGGVSLWLFPEIRPQTLQWATPLLREVPGLDKWLGVEKSSDTSPAPVRIKDVRQRTVANLLVGTLRVIEGVAVNQSPYPLANIRVRLVISDAYDVVLNEKTVSCGNILTDAELNTLAEAEILRALSTPEGTDVSNRRVEPNGEIPFMIVFSHEQAGAIKTVVMPAGADRVS